VVGRKEKGIISSRRERGERRGREVGKWWNGGGKVESRGAGRWNQRSLRGSTEFKLPKLQNQVVTYNHNMLHGLRLIVPRGAADSEEFRIGARRSSR